MSTVFQEEEINSFRQNTLYSFSRIQGRLLDLCLNRAQTSALEPVVGDIISYRDILSLIAMAERDFIAGVEKSLQSLEDPDKSANIDPHPFDLFQMKMTLLEEKWERPFALCVPVQDRELMWYDGGTHLYPIKEGDPHRKVASLSGVSRVLEALHHGCAQNFLMQQAMERQAIFSPVDLHGVVVRYAWFSQLTAGLNDSQREAVATVVHPQFKSGFFAIQGPPGCGKTTTCIRMIQATKQQHPATSVLVAAPSNAAVANLALSLFRIHRDLVGTTTALQDMIVVGENVDETAAFLSPIKRGREFAKLCDGLDKIGPGKKGQEEIAKFRSWLGLKPADPEEEVSLAQLSQLCPYIDTQTSTGRSQYVSLLRSKSLVCCTLNALGSPLVQRCVSATTIFLDEAGQCTEAEFYIAASFPSAKRVIVMGDPMQLPATVIDPICKASGFGSSWLSQVLRLQPSKVHLLDTQYRMDPSILAFPNEKFYRSRILSSEVVYGRTPFVEKPFSFVDTKEGGIEEKEGFSWTNVYEIAVIKSLLFNDSDIKRLLKQPGGKTRIIIISPYKAQVDLIKKEVEKFRTCQIDVATVDSFQGQEADIVILSTVRTHQTGFIDDGQRLNVALTRAKRVLRIVGNLAFFLSLPCRSILRQLAEHARTKEYLILSEVKKGPWSRPNWNQNLLWKVLTTAKFNDCIRRLPCGSANVCMNTLFALASGQTTELHARRIPERNSPGWYVTAYKGFYDQVRVVWSAKRGNTDDEKIIEAAFAGSPKKCFQFLQKNPTSPVDSCIVLPCMSGFRPSRVSNADDTLFTSPQRFLASWALSNETRRRFQGGVPLPLTSIQLDSKQENVARSSPPLLIESRSGTGKTLVLLQHVAYYAKYANSTEEESPALFVTLSSRLRNKLEDDYEDMKEVSTHPLPSVVFFSFDQLLRFLLGVKKIQDFEELERCTFKSYMRASKSYKKQSICDADLVESEIGGVILGSLAAAESRRPLTLEEYCAEKRSNVGRKSEKDINTRRHIYNEYQKYASWKSHANQFDTNDVVLRLLNEKWKELFFSACLDEIQDLSYASVKLVCLVAGRNNSHWLCAGDAAQMISPGCSFEFDGLKQTLLSVNPDIESQLASVTQLLVNYRTTKDILELANEILAIARQAFPNAIPFARTEIANTDLGLRVVLCDWSVALMQEVEMGTSQALIYSSDTPERLHMELVNWLGSHPFILSSLESKGLEFDDVIVAFRFERKDWCIKSERQSTLRMLRELYVAVTRAKRRVVILFEGERSASRLFFDSIPCTFQVDAAEMVLSEFKQVTSTEDWMKRGHELFDSEQFLTASRCFSCGKHDGWYHFARGKHQESEGNYSTASVEYTRSLEYLVQVREYDLFLRVAAARSKPSICRRLDSSDQQFVAAFNLAMSLYPSELSRFEAVRTALAHEAWDQLSVEDLKDVTLSNLFHAYRGNKNLISKLSGQDAACVEKVLPLFAADFFLENGTYYQAVRIFLDISNSREAILATKMALNQIHKTSKDGSLLQIIQLWCCYQDKPTGGIVDSLTRLFQSVEEASLSSAKQCMHDLGRDVILFAVDNDKEASRLLLHRFNSAEFYQEVSATLASEHAENPLEAVRWFYKADDTTSALTFFQKRLRRWDHFEYVALADISPNLPPWYFEELARRDLRTVCCVKVFASSDLTSHHKRSFMRAFKDSAEGRDHLMVLCTSYLSLLSPKQPRKSVGKTKKGKRSRKGAVTDTVARPEVTFKEEDFSLLLQFVLPCLDGKEAKAELLEKCRGNVGYSMPSAVALIQHGLAHHSIEWCVSLTTSIVSSKFSKKRLNNILRIWTQKIEKGISLNELSLDASDRLFSSLLEFATRVDDPRTWRFILSRSLHSGIFPTIMQNPDEVNTKYFRKLISDRTLDLAFELTRSALSRGHPFLVVSFVDEITLIHWRKDVEKRESAMPRDARTVLSLLQCLVAETCIEENITWFDVAAMFGKDATAELVRSFASSWNPHEYQEALSACIFAATKTTPFFG